MHTVPCCDILKSSFNIDCQQQQSWTPRTLSYLINHFHFSVSCRRRQPDLFRLDTKMLFTVLCDSHLHFCRRHLDSLLKSCCWDLVRSEEEVATSWTEHQKNEFNSDIRAGRHSSAFSLLLCTGQTGNQVALNYILPGSASPSSRLFPCYFPPVISPDISLSLSLSHFRLALTSVVQQCTKHTVATFRVAQCRISGSAIPEAEYTRNSIKTYSPSCLAGSPSRHWSVCNGRFTFSEIFVFRKKR